MMRRIPDRWFGSHWYKNGRLHREGGPAITNTDGSNKEWYQNGKRHRLDGPARINYGTKEYWIDGVRYYQLFWLTIYWMKLKALVT